MLSKEITLIKDDGAKSFTEIFSQLQVGQVLDIATGPGGFVVVLKQFLKSYDQIIGIDVRPDLLERAREAHPEENIAFKQMDAAEMNFPGDQFDLVCCAFSLHHLEEIEPVLMEIKRVVKPEGMVVFVEMYKDGQTEAQLTEVSIHHFAADIDMQTGNNHNHTFDRAEIINLLQDRFELLDAYDFADLTRDPKDEETRETIENIIDMVCDRGKDLADYSKFQQRAEALKQRLAEVGTHPATRLVVAAKG